MRARDERRIQATQSYPPLTESSKMPRIRGLLAEEADEIVPTPVVLGRVPEQEAPVGMAVEVEHVAMLYGAELHDRRIVLLVGEPNGNAHGVGCFDRLLIAMLLAPDEHFRHPPFAVKLHQIHLGGLGKSHLLLRELTDDFRRVVVKVALPNCLSKRRRVVGRDGDRFDHLADERRPGRRRLRNELLLGRHERPSQHLLEGNRIRDPTLLHGGVHVTRQRTRHCGHQLRELIDFSHDVLLGISQAFRLRLSPGSW